MDELTLYRVDARGRINLAGVVADGVEYYSAAKEIGPDGQPTGTIRLAPVRIATTSVKRAAADATETDNPTGETPWDQ